VADCPIEWLSFSRRLHRYDVKLAGNSSKRWSGASSWGKQIEDQSALGNWKARTIAVGAARAPHLITDYQLANSRDEQDEIIEALLKVGGGSDASDLGSRMHRVTEQHDMGVLGASLDPLVATTVQRWERALDLAGISVVGDHVERIVINTRLGCCATFDRLAWWNDRLVVVDLKTGSMKYPHSMAVQLAIIANAEWITVGEPEIRGDKAIWTSFEPTPNIDKDDGLIVHLPAATPDKVAVWVLDLEDGWDAAVLAHQARLWTRSQPAQLLVEGTVSVVDNDPDDLLAGL
jgi:hypothetical protein